MEYVAQQITSFLATNLTDTYTDYNPATTYTFETGTPTNASVARYESYYYRSLVNGNVGNTPTEYENIKWLKWSVSNKFAMLDLSAQSKSRYAGDMYVEFLQGQMTTLGIGYYEATYITIEIKDIYNNILWTYNTYNSLNDDVIDYYSYIYEPYHYEIDKSFKIDLPLFGYKVKVTFHKSSESTTTACGFLVGGIAVNMGKTLTDINFKFTSYAVKTFDDFGSLTIVKRAVQDLVDFETIAKNNQMSMLKREIKKVYNDIVMFIVDESDNSIYENLITLGTIQDAGAVISEYEDTIMTFSVIEAV